MAFLVTLIFGICLLANLVVLPICRYYRKIWTQRFEEEYRQIQLRAVKRHYAATLEGLSWREIEERFDVNEAYDRIRC